MSISVDGDVNLSHCKLKKIPIKFKEVSGNFDVSDNYLTSLYGCPERVGWTFECSKNKLESLEFSPREVGKDFYCDHNYLTSLSGCPERIMGHFMCRSNLLTSMEFGPKEVGGSIGVHDNKLTSFIGCPEIVVGKIFCSGNRITSFSGIPPFFSNDIEFWCSDGKGNPIREVYRLFKSSECVYWLNEFDVIQGNKVIFNRLEEVYIHMGIKIPKRKKILLRQYKLI